MPYIQPIHMSRRLFLQNTPHLTASLHLNCFPTSPLSAASLLVSQTPSRRVSHLPPPLSLTPFLQLPMWLTPSLLVGPGQMPLPLRNLPRPFSLALVPRALLCFPREHLHHQAHCFLTHCLSPTLECTGHRFYLSWSLSVTQSKDRAQ